MCGLPELYIPECSSPVNVRNLQLIRRVKHADLHGMLVEQRNPAFYSCMNYICEGMQAEIFNRVGLAMGYLCFQDVAVEKLLIYCMHCK